MMIYHYLEVHQPFSTVDRFIMSNVKIIAEIGINHDGVFEKASALINAAARSCCHAVKFQYRNLDNAYSVDGSREIGDEILLAEIKRAYLS